MNITNELNLCTARILEYRYRDDLEDLANDIDPYLLSKDSKEWIPEEARTRPYTSYFDYLANLYSLGYWVDQCISIMNGIQTFMQEYGYKTGVDIEVNDKYIRICYAGCYMN